VPRAKAVQEQQQIKTMKKQLEAQTKVNTELLNRLIFLEKNKYYSLL
jgi:hypothetical protein